MKISDDDDKATKHSFSLTIAALSSLSKLGSWLPTLISHLFQPDFYSSWPLASYFVKVLLKCK